MGFSLERTNRTARRQIYVMACNSAETFIVAKCE
ncbi:hypothetical protein M2189_006738 [Bradyrhizobium japonicum]|nr:hypothetical protein [Bradyrhizobium japonicum]MCS3995848.1 hypothetical protein [Bradyrhizobium japonicum]